MRTCQVKRKRGGWPHSTPSSILLRQEGKDGNGHVSLLPGHGRTRATFQATGTPRPKPEDRLKRYSPCPKPQDEEAKTKENTYRVIVSYACQDWKCECTKLTALDSPALISSDRIHRMIVHSKCDRKKRISTSSNSQTRKEEQNCSQEVL